MQSTQQSALQPALEGTEEHVINSRLNGGQFGDEERPVAEAVHRERGLGPLDPVIPDEQREVAAAPRPWKPWLLPMLFATFAGGVAGRQVGAAFGGAIGDALLAGGFAYIGWQVGARVAWQTRRIVGNPGRFAAAIAAVLVWVVAMGLLGMLAQNGTGRIHP
jgi:hypothetical protein